MERGFEQNPQESAQEADESRGIESYLERVKNDASRELIHGFFGAFDKLSFEKDSGKRQTIEAEQRAFIDKLRLESENEVADELESMIGASVEVLEPHNGVHE